VLGREDDDLVKLSQVCQEVVDTRTFGGSPAILSLGVTLVSYRTFGTIQVQLTSQVDVTSKSSKESRSVKGF
jgi:hypothetical protein